MEINSDLSSSLPLQLFLVFIFTALFSSRPFFFQFAAFTFYLGFGYGPAEGSQWVCIADPVPHSPES